MSQFAALLEQHAGADEAAAWRLGERCHVVLVAENVRDNDVDGVLMAVLRANDKGPPLPQGSPPWHPRGWWKNRGFCAITDVVGMVTQHGAAELHDSIKGARWVWLPLAQMRQLREVLERGALVELEYSPFTRAWTLAVHVDGEVLYV